eukprot:9882541-Lingulodinium_polyedra.AAC.1
MVDTCIRTAQVRVGKIQVAVAAALRSGAPPEAPDETDVIADLAAHAVRKGQSSELVEQQAARL